jgi:hypothetical protein
MDYPMTGGRRPPRHSQSLIDKGLAARMTAMTGISGVRQYFHSITHEIRANFTVSGPKTAPCLGCFRLADESRHCDPPAVAAETVAPNSQPLA